jgi:hypothetical protein
MTKERSSPGGPFIFLGVLGVSKIAFKNAVRVLKSYFLKHQEHQEK